MSGTDREKVAPPRVGPPPLRPFGLVLWRDGRWTHDGQPILNRRLRERFDRSVVYLVEEEAYVVQIGRFRGQIEVEETGFFVRSIGLDDGTIALSDGSTEPLEVGSLTWSRLDGALICRIKRDLVADGLPARFLHSAQADLLACLDEGDPGLVLRLGTGSVRLPARLWREASD